MLSRLGLTTSRVFDRFSPGTLLFSRWHSNKVKNPTGTELGPNRRVSNYTYVEALAAQDLYCWIVREVELGTLGQVGELGIVVGSRLILPESLDGMGGWTGFSGIKGSVWHPLSPRVRRTGIGEIRRRRS